MAGYFIFAGLMKAKTTQIKAFALLMIFVINMTALCSCGFAQPAVHHKMKMDKDCCCCKKDAPKKDCKDTHTISFNQMDKAVANAVSMQFSAVHYFLVSPFVSLPENNFPFIRPVYNSHISCIDTSPPDLNILFRLFLI